MEISLNTGIIILYTILIIFIYYNLRVCQNEYKNLMTVLLNLNKKTEKFKTKIIKLETSLKHINGQQNQQLESFSTIEKTNLLLRRRLNEISS